jgi:hypothetical protein
MTAHSEVGASIAHRFINCPASVSASRGKDNLQSEDAAKGTAAHTLGEECLALVKASYPGTGYEAYDWMSREIVVGNYAFTVDEDMAESVQLYVDTVREDMQRGDLLLVEQRFSLEELRQGMFGTNDALLYHRPTGLLRVYDFKNGVVPVDAVENPQLMYYAIGAVLAHPTLPISEVELVIVQPNGRYGDKVKRWRLDVLDLLEFASVLGKAVDATRADDPPFAAGAWCKYCPAAPGCDALRARVREQARREFADSPDELDTDTLAEIAAEAEIIFDWVKAVKAEQLRRAKCGDIPHGMKLVATQARRKWREDEERTVDMLDANFGLLESAIYDRKLKSPAQVEKLLMKDLRPELASLIVKASTGVKLVPLSAPGEPVSITSAAEDFADI